MGAAGMALPRAMVLEPKVFGDGRGFFFESFNARRFEQETGAQATFVQDNHSLSVRNVLRGLHYQIQCPQGKLVRVTSGEVFDVAVDIRRSSPEYGRWISVHLSADNKRHLWIPPGYAHGFQVLTDSAEVLYKTSDYRAPEHERCIRWDDTQLAINWPEPGQPLLSAKDKVGVSLADAEVYR